MLRCFIKAIYRQYIVYLLSVKMLVLQAVVTGIKNFHEIYNLYSALTHWNNVFV
jgi:hypothetical protein